MSVELPIELTVAQAHDAAIDDVNRWRGHCVECFARLERSMGEALESIASDAPPTKRLPVTFGNKVTAMRTALSSPGAAPASLLKSLQRADELLDQRNRIVHAAGKVWIDRSGNWTWAYKFKPASTPEESGMYHQTKAREFEAQLAKTSRSLCDQLKAFSKKRAVTRT